MQTCRITTSFLFLLFTCAAMETFAQKVGVLTTQPQAPFHVASSGQVNTPGGLMILGDTTEAHLEMDFNILQSNYGNGPLLMQLQPAGGDLRVGSSALHINGTSGNVGIGTTMPASRLHMAGNTDQLLKIQRTTDGMGLAGIDLLRGGEFSSTDWRIVNDGGVLKIFDAIDNFTGSGDLDVAFTNSGHVGIGILSPEAEMHIIGDDLIDETGEGYLQLGSPGGLHVRFDNNEILARNNNSASLLYLQFWSGNLSLCDNNSGRVGIGMGSPQGKLHVTDGTDVSLASGGELILGPTSGPNVAMDGNEIQSRDNGTAGTLFIQAEGGDVLLIPNEAGQVGIGVNSSANMPAPDYLLAVDGKIISEEIRVEVSGSWPDYVFDPDYRLRPLIELEKEIAIQGHLPGLPPASHVEEEGILLGEMQRVMLEKIEELTLYVIALQKEIDALKNDLHVPNE